MSATIRFDHVSVSYGAKVALREVVLEIPEKQIFGIIGPANSGKTTLLKCINRTIDFAPSARVTGKVIVAGQDVFRVGHHTALRRLAGVCRRGARHLQGVFRPARRTAAGPEPAEPSDAVELRTVHELRRRIGMVFPLPVGLPLSVYENVAYAPRRAGMRDRRQLDELVEKCLRQAMLWDEVKDRLDLLGTRLSGGQQQRLTLARALSHQPEILCLDEFSIAIDPVTTMKIEDVLRELKSRMTIVLVTNLVQQARRLADRTAFLSDSRLIEVDETERLFTRPANRLTERFVNGEFG
jgi:phosphate transport system ATP-binding protein